MQTNVLAHPAARQLPSPARIKEALDRSVSGNDAAKRYLASVVFKHLALAEGAGASGSRSHTLLLGPTGAGKSYLVAALREAVDVPVVSIDATTLTEAGYHGRDVDAMFDDLLREAGLDRSRAESGIVFIDEFDKLRAAPAGERDIRGLGVQYSLLKILDGDLRQVSSVRTSRLQAASVGSSQQLDTRRLLFIFAGAFSAFPELMTCEQCSPRALAKVGFLEELVARIPNIIRLESLRADAVAAALDNLDAGIMKEYQVMFTALGRSFEIVPSARTAICKAVLDLGIGYRGLRAVLDSLLLPPLVEFEAQRAAGPRDVLVIDHDTNGFRITWT